MSLHAHGGCAVALMLVVLLAHAGLGVCRTQAMHEDFRVSAADVLHAHYPAAAAEVDADDADESDESDESGSDSHSDYSDMVSPPPPPPPPPFAAFLQLEQQIAQRTQRTKGSTVAQAAVAHARAGAAGVQRAQRAALAERLPSRASRAGAGAAGLHTAQLEARARVRSGANANANANTAAAAAAAAKAQGRSRHRAQVREADPFPEQSFTYKDENSPPDWLVPQKSEPAGPTTKPPPVPQMIPPPPPVPFPTYNYQDPNAAGPFSQYAPGVQGWGYDGGYAGPYDGFSMYGHPPNSAQVHGWEHPEIPRTAAQIASATAASQYHPYGAPPPLYSLGNPPPDGAASWVPVGAFLKPGTMEGGAGND